MMPHFSPIENTIIAMCVGVFFALMVAGVIAAHIGKSKP